MAINYKSSQNGSVRIQTIRI